MKFNHREETEALPNAVELNRLDEAPKIFTKNQKSIKDIIVPSGINATNYNHIEFFSKVPRYARSFYIASVPRIATFGAFLDSMYDFGDINVSIHIEPIPESVSQNDLNKVIADIDSELIIAQNRMDNNRYALLADKRAEADQIRSESIPFTNLDAP